MTQKTTLGHHCFLLESRHSPGTSCLPSKAKYLRHRGRLVETGSTWKIGNLSQTPAAVSPCSEVTFLFYHGAQSPGPVTAAPDLCTEIEQKGRSSNGFKLNILELSLIFTHLGLEWRWGTEWTVTVISSGASFGTTGATQILGARGAGIDTITQHSSSPCHPAAWPRSLILPLQGQSWNTCSPPRWILSKQGGFCQPWGVLDPS